MCCIIPLSLQRIAELTANLRARSEKVKGLIARNASLQKGEHEYSTLFIRQGPVVIVKVGQKL